MKWFGGSIAEAVATSKKRNAVFVVFIEGGDELSTTVSSALDIPGISRSLESDSFVSIRLENGSESHQQFSEIYKLVPVPSVFFIGHNGAPLEVIVGDISQENVIGKLNGAIKKCLDLATSAKAKTPTDSSILGTAVASCSTSQPIPIPQGSSNISTTNEITQCENAAPKESPPVKQEVEKSKELKEEIAQDKPETAASSSSSAERPDVETAQTEEGSQQVESVEAKVERAKQLLEKKKEDKRLQEEMEERERELERRRVGQEMMEAKRKQQDRELKELRQERLREKQEENAAKQRVLEQIAQDRAERLARLQPNGSGQQAAASPEVFPQPLPLRTSPPIDQNTTRIQFKLPDGQTRTHSFSPDTTIIQLRQFVDNNIELPFSEYQLATTFPRREFTVRENNLDLRSLELFPSGVILIMPIQGNMTVSRGATWPSAIMNMFWDLLQPVFSLSRYVQGLIWGGESGRSSGGTGISQGSAPQGGSSAPVQRSRYGPSQPLGRSGVRKRGNVHSLADPDSSNDENNTWNGNSTQQM